MTQENDHLIDRVVLGMRNVAEELEEFQVQLALGKMDALAKYDELKHRFNERMNQVKNNVEKGQELWEEFKIQLEELQVQLALGKAESLERFKEERAKILSKIHDIEQKIKSHPMFINWYPEVMEEFEKLKIKLEVLEDFADGAKSKAAEEIAKRKEQVLSLIDQIQDRLKERSSKDFDWQVFQFEMSEAYSHMKKAFFQ
jgi:hypothetical protein